jgi:hypothetical protein
MRILIAGLFLALPLFAQDTEKKEPAALTKAREGYQVEVARVLTPVTKTYLDKLEALKKDLGAKGKIEEAMAVQQEIEAVTPKPMSESFFGKWKDRYGTWEFRAGGKCSLTGSNGKKDGVWQRSGKDIVVTWPDGVDTFNPQLQNGKLTGASTSHGGFALTLQRVSN